MSTGKNKSENTATLYSHDKEKLEGMFRPRFESFQNKGYPNEGAGSLVLND